MAVVTITLSSVLDFTPLAATIWQSKTAFSGFLVTFKYKRQIFDAPKSRDFFINFDFANEIESGWARSSFEEVKDKKLIFY